MIGFFDRQDYWCFRDMDSFFDHVLRPKYSGWRFFAHFGGRFDIHFVFDQLVWNPKSRWHGASFTFHVSGSCVIAFTIMQGDHWWRFCDSYRLMPASLHRITHDLDVEHKKLPFDPQSVEYNRTDCLGLYEVLTVFFNEFGWYSETIAAHAMRVFRGGYLEQDIMIPPRDVEADVRKCYHGGRTEIYRYDRATVNKFDVNSLYPFVMTRPVPVEYLERSTKVPDDNSQIGFYQADVTVPDSIYVPIVPYNRDKLFFPTGRIENAFMTSMEIREAAQEGCAIKVKAGILFHAEPVLAPFVYDLHEKKQKAERDGHKGMRYIFKIVMNSLYGKFGQQRSRRAYIFDPGTTHFEGKPVWPMAELPGLAWYEAESKSCHILPHISAAVTAYARLVTSGFLAGPVKFGSKIWYTDTDSLFSDDMMGAAGELGELAYEGSGSFQAYNLKEYLWRDEYSIKGVQVRKKDPRTGEVVYNKALAEAYIRGDEIKQGRMVGFLESIRQGQPTVRRVEVTRQQRHPLHKRCRVGDDSRPWRVEELL